MFDNGTLVRLRGGCSKAFVWGLGGGYEVLVRADAKKHKMTRAIG